MKQILCFGDSNTWGLDGETGKRFPWEERWTGILQEKLADRDIRIVEEVCVEERPYLKIRFAWEDGEQNCFRHYWRRTRRMQSY